MTNKSICILNYGSGNVRSVYNVMRHLGHNVLISNEEQKIKNSSHLLLPGVGSFSSTMKKIRENLPFDCLENEVISKGKPFLGICVGMQVLAKKGYEFEQCEGFGWISGSVRKLSTENLSLPHVGWNNILIENPHSIFNKLKEYRDFYYVHSYCFDAHDEGNVLAYTDYGEKFSAVVCKDNIYGFQFHPEKSQRAGQLLLNNFVMTS